MEELWGIIGHMLTGKDVIELIASLLQFNNNDVPMSVSSNGPDFRRGRILFVAHEETVGFPSVSVPEMMVYESRRNNQNKFKEIEVIFKKDADFRTFYAIYKSKSLLKQQEIIKGLEEMQEVFCRGKELKAVVTLLKEREITVDTSWDEFPNTENIVVKQLKLTMTIG